MILALDLEGTLVSNAVSQIPRPGLMSFLQEASVLASRVVLFTAVSEARVRTMVEELVRRGEAPEWLGRVPVVRWEGPHKRLHFVPGHETEAVLLVDDMRQYVHPDDLGHWVEVRPFVAPYPEDDVELDDVLDRIRRKARQIARKEEWTRARGKAGEDAERPRATGENDNGGLPERRLPNDGSESMSHD